MTASRSRLKSRPWRGLTAKLEASKTSSDEARRALPIVLAVTIGAVVAFAELADHPVVNSPTAIWLSVVLVVVGILTDALSYFQSKGSAGSAALIPLGATILITPDWRGLMLIAGAQALMQIAHRRGAIKMLFNTSQVLLGFSVSAIAFNTLGGQSFVLMEGTRFVDAALLNLLPGVAALVLFILLNQITISVIIAATALRNPIAVWSDTFRPALAISAVQVLVAYYLAWLSANLGAWGALGIVVPILALKQLAQTSHELTQVTEELLDLMVAAIEARDPYTSGHSKRVAESSRIIAKAMGLSEAQVERVEVAALMHDVGKIDERFARILAKEGRLTPEEWETMKQHPVRSAELVGMLTSLKDLIPAVRHHHENWDGTGYPDGIAGDNIPLGSRIIMFADTLDAITTDRPYRKALDPSEARREFIKFRGKQFDPEICDRVVSADVWADLYAAVRKSKESEPDPVPEPQQRAAAG